MNYLLINHVRLHMNATAENQLTVAETVEMLNIYLTPQEQHAVIEILMAADCCSVDDVHTFKLAHLHLFYPIASIVKCHAYAELILKTTFGSTNATAYDRACLVVDRLHDLSAEENECLKFIIAMNQ